MKSSQHKTIVLSLLLLLCSFSRNVVLVVCANGRNGASTVSLHNKNLIDHIQKWMDNPDGTAQEFDHISKWDTSNVTNMRNLFSFHEEFNEDISQWNVARVTDFSSMFWEANTFDINLGGWDVSSGETMDCMFCGASSYTGQGLEEWKDKLGNVKDMFNLFEGSAIQADLSEWEVSSVTNFRQMFMDTPLYDQQLCWNVSLLARTTEMFNNSKACFQNKCVADHILAGAGCSAGMSSLGGSSSTIVMLGLAGLMSLATTLI